MVQCTSESSAVVMLHSVLSFGQTGGHVETGGGDAGEGFHASILEQPKLSLMLLWCFIPLP